MATDDAGRIGGASAQRSAQKSEDNMQKTPFGQTQCSNCGLLEPLCWKDIVDDSESVVS